MVREHGDAIDAVELASRMELHVTTVRFHLDALCDEGAIERTRIYRDGVGRPPHRISRRRGAPGLPGFSPRSSRWNWEKQWRRRARRAPSAGRMGGPDRGFARAKPLQTQDVTDTAEVGDPLDRGAVLATEVFNRMGGDPELAAESEPMASVSADSKQIVGRERVIRLRACPVRDLARAHPEVGCGIHLGLLQGLLDHAAAAAGQPDTQNQGLSARLDPFVEPELCIARLNASRRSTRD